MNTVGLKKVPKKEPDLETKLRMEMEKKDKEIEALQAKAEERRKRQEEDARRQEEEKARLEAERRHREEEERRRKEELAQKRRQQELEKLKSDKEKSNINTQVLEMSAGGGSKLSNVLKAKEDMQKSAEQLEQEKREILSSRIVRIDLNGKNKDDLARMAQEYFEILKGLHSQVYDLQEKYDRQKYDMMELAERARQIEKGKAKTRKSNIVHTGLGGSISPHIAESFPQAPGKISLFSRYERVTDRRTFKDRRDLWAVAKEKKEVAAEKPKAKIKHVDEPKKDDFKRKPRTKSTEEKPAEEEQHHEEEEPQAAAEEEAPAEE